MRRAVLLVAVAASLGAARTASAQLASAVGLGRPNPDDTVHVDAYLGLDYAVFNRDTPTYIARGLSAEPYLLKTADVEVSNLSKFDFGLNAAATSLLAVGGFASPGDSSSNGDVSEAERYAGMIRYAIGTQLKLRTEATFARFATYLAPNFESRADFPHTTYSAPAGGGLVRLHPGGGMGGNTNWYSAAFGVDMPTNFLGLNAQTTLSYRYSRLDTLSAYSVDYPSDFTAFQAVVADEVACHSASFDMRATRHVFSDAHLQMGLHFATGYSQITSAFVDAGEGMCVDYGGVAALALEQQHWSLTLGGNFDQVIVVTFAGGNTLKQSAAYNDAGTGRVLNAPAGSQWHVSGPNESIYIYGAFLHLTVHF